MTNGDSGRPQEGMSFANGSGNGSGGPWTTATGVPPEPFRPDPLEDDSYSNDPFASEPDPFADGADPFAIEPLPGSAASTSGNGSGTSAAKAQELGGELDLGDSEMRLPWLEGDDEDFEDERGGLGQTTILLLLALVAIGLLAGGIFWALKGQSDTNLVADGGVIEAPAEPYKTKPKDPGGEVVDGTGDTSFAVAEGQSRTPQIAEDSGEPAAPGFSSISQSEAKAQPTPEAKAEEAAPSGVGVQVGAYTSKATAEKGWLTLKGQYAPLAEMKHRVVQGQADIGTVFRLQALPGDLKAARSLCSDMRKAGLSCQVKG